MYLSVFDKKGQKVEGNREEVSCLVSTFGENTYPDVWLNRIGVFNGKTFHNPYIFFVYSC